MMQNTGLFDKNKNPIFEGMHLLFKPPSDLNTQFYTSYIGKECKNMEADAFLIYILPSEYISLDYMCAFIKKDNTLITQYEYEKCKNDLEKIEIKIDDNKKEIPYIGKSVDAYLFIKYLSNYGISILEKTNYNLTELYKGK
jgi:hypothetical protein